MQANGLPGTKSNCSRTSRCHGIGVRSAGRPAAKDGNAVLSWGEGAARSLSFPCVWKVPVGRAALPPRPALVLARVGQAFSSWDAWSPSGATPNPSAPGRGPTCLHQARATGAWGAVGSLPQAPQGNVLLSGPFPVTCERDRRSSFPCFSIPPPSPASGRFDVLGQTELHDRGHSPGSSFRAIGLSGYRWPSRPWNPGGGGHRT